MQVISRPCLEAESEKVEDAPPNRSVSLRKDFLWTLIGNGIYAVSQWLVIVLLARWTRPELVGTYSFAVAVATPLITFGSFQLRSIQVTDVRGEHHFSDYLGFRLLSMFGAMAILILLCLALRYSISMAAMIVALGLALAVESVSDIYYGRMQVHNRMDSIAKSMMIRGVISTLAMVGIVLLTSSILLGVIAMVVARLSVLFLFDGRASRTLHPLPIRPSDRGARPRWIFPTQKVLFTTSLPIGLVSVLVALNTSIPRYFLEWSSGPRELGIFAALSFFQSSGNLVVGAMVQAAFGRLATSYAREDKRGFYPLLLKLVAIGAGLGIAGLIVTSFAGKQILQVMYGHEYAARANLLTYLMVAAGLGYCCQFLGSAVTAARIFKPQMTLFAVVASSLTVFCYLLVPGHGAIGAITAIVISTLIQISGFALLLFLRAKKSGRHGNAFLTATEELVASGSTS